MGTDSPLSATSPYVSHHLSPSKRGSNTRLTLNTFALTYSRPKFVSLSANCVHLLTLPFPPWIFEKMSRSAIWLLLPKSLRAEDYQLKSKWFTAFKASS